MKKLLSAALASALVISACPTFAENTDKMQEVLTSVKERVGDTEKYENFTSNSYSKDGKTTIYRFEWNTREDKWETLNVSCTEDGIITSLNKYGKREHDDKLSINRTKKSEAKKAAEAALLKLNPEIASHIKVGDSDTYEDFRSSEYFFTLQRYENNLPVENDSGSIYLDKDLNVTGFYITYTTDMSFAPAENLITTDAAKDAYNKNLGAKLSYITKWNNETKKREVKLVYNTEFNNKYINAATGEVIEIKPYDYGDNGTENAKADTAASGGGSEQEFSKAEQKNIDTIEGLITKENADSIIRGCKYFAIPQDASVSSNNLTYSEYDDEYTYSFYYLKKDANNETSYRSSADVNAKTGEIKRFYTAKIFSPDTNAENEKAPEVDRAKLSETAKIIIADLAGDKAKEYRENDWSDSKAFATSFTRYINDIPFDEDTIYVLFDYDYNLTSYSISYSDLTFPAPENILTKEQAFDSIAELGNYRIVYMPDYKNKTFIPVYDLENRYTVDAFTGKSLYENNLSKDGGNYTDIAGHYAEDKIKTLAEYGIFFEGSELHPDDVITQKDFSALLSIVFEHNDVEILRNYDACKANYFSSDIKYTNGNTAPDAPLTRGEAAKLMIRAMGIEEYAALSGIYKDLYSDVSDGIGYINILTGLGVVSGDGSGNFKPNAELTRAQALVMIYNYLAR